MSREQDFDRRGSCLICGLSFLSFECPHTIGENELRTGWHNYPTVHEPGTYDSCAGCTQFLRSELSALRAAQPLTREVIDAVIERVFAAYGIDEPSATKPSRFALELMQALRDALLDSLADKGE